MFVGLIAMRDWCMIASCARPSKPALERSGLAILLITGLLLFRADSTRYVSNSAFLLKIALTAVGLLFEYLVRPKWQTRGAAAASLTLWSAVVVASRLVADFDK
jgi:hypothetical protein